MSWEEMAKKGYFWAIIRQRVQVTRLPGPSETVTVETWPGITTRVAYPRHSVGYDEQGNELFRAVSLWVLMDLNTRSMVLPGKNGVDLTGIDRPGQLPTPASLGVSQGACSQVRSVRFCELDRNGHMSNTRYLDWAADLLGSGFHRDHALADFTVCYLSEATEEEAVTLGYTCDGEGLRVEAASDELPKSFLLYRTRDSWEICFSQLSSSALAGRVEHGIVKWERGERPVHEDFE
jgi:acyl-ACP thioesterase